MSDDPYNDLLQLRRLIVDARELITEASRTACGLVGNAADPEDNGWVAMGSVSYNLDRIYQDLAGVLPPEINKAIDDAEAYLDELADKADGQSY